MDRLRKVLKKRINKKGYTIQELLIVMIIIAVLFAAGFIGRSIYIERAKMTTLRSDFNNFEYALQQALLENPTISKLDQEKQLSLINKYLSEEIKFDEVDSMLVCKKNDPWDMPFIMWLTTENNTNTGTYDETTATTVDSTNDTEYRIFVKSYAKNNKSEADANGVDNDDCILLLQMVNGEVKTATFNLDKEKGAFTFADDSKDTLTGAYTK